MSKKKIIFIEDENNYIEAYQKPLGLIQGFLFDTPEIYHDKESASKKINDWEKDQTTTPDLVFLDLILPTTPKIYDEFKDEQDFSKKSVAMMQGDIDSNAGIELYRKIRGLGPIFQRTKDTKHLIQLPIIILTANYRLPPSTRANMQDDVYLCWIDKPFKPKVAAGIVKKFLMKHSNKTEPQS